jgi:toxin ParE1/3/4
MSLRIQRSEWFIGDLEHYAAWYDKEAGWALAERYLNAVSATISKLADMPDLGRKTRFSSPTLRNLRYLPVEQPFDKHLVFYRHDESTLYIERVVHGARDLPIRLTEPPVEEP